MRPIKLTKQTAVKLIRRVCPVPVSAIVGPGGDGTVARFTVSVGSGDLRIVCENDWFDRNGCIRLTVSDAFGGGCMVMYFDPKTLERNFLEEDRIKRKETVEERRNWVAEIGPDKAHELVDQYWEESC